MGFEIKNICTVVPNPYHSCYNPKHPSYENGKYYYFSLFITPRLQFDGTLKEFYEMLHWPEYAEKIFWKFKEDKNIISDKLDEHIDDFLTTCFLSSPDKPQISLTKDYELLRPILRGMGIINEDNNKIGTSEISDFLNKAKQTWKKLFHENVPVEAWPINLKPQISTIVVSEKKEERPKVAGQQPQRQAATGGTSLQQTSRVSSIQNADVANPHNNEASKSQKSLREEKYNASKFRQELHKKISALARYPHILRVLGLIQDFKVEKSQLTSINTPDFLLRLEFSTSIHTTNSENYPFDEFFRSVQFVRPYTKCEYNNSSKDRLRSHLVSSKNMGDVAIYKDKVPPNYEEFVIDGFLRTVKVSNVKDKVFSVDQEYYEDKSADFSDTDLANDSNVVGFNKKTFSSEDIAVLKQKVADKPKISKGFSIKVHGQPTGILINMDEQFQKITDDNIEEETSAFMAHHLDCGYRVDVLITIDNKSQWKSLCQREARYVVDLKDDDWKIPMFRRNITVYRGDNNLFKKLQDEPWLEEVRQIDEDGNANRFEEIARWNGWSLTCPPLYKNYSAPNDEADDMELKDIKPPKGSLPKLRFGKDYKFRIRTVDICGNGPQLNDNLDKSLEGQYIFHYVPGYQRFEFINPPMFFAPYELVPDLATATDKDVEIKKEKDGFKIDLRYKGEDNETLVVRSRINKDKCEYITQDCVRFLTAPHITPHFAEISGFLDLSLNNPTDLYNFLKNAPKHFYKEDEIINSVPFPTDNLIEEFYINDEPTGVKISLGTDFKSKPLKIVLRENNFIYYYPITKKNVIHPKFASLRAGEERVLTVSSMLSESMTSKYSQLIDQKASTKKFKIIHAVQRPFLEGLKTNSNIIEIHDFLKFEKIQPKPETYKPNQKYQVSIVLNETFNKPSEFFPFSTTGELILHAEYCDYELNPDNTEGWSYISKAHPKDKHSSTNNAEDADNFYITKSWSNLDEATEEDKLDTILKDVIHPADDNSKSSFTTIKDNFKLFIHSFPDTKFRKVKYSIEAVSKFSEFFDIEKHEINKNDKNPFSVFATLNSELDGTTIIRNSSKPSKPNITSVVPVFTTTDLNGVYTFEHKTFRIYLGSVWYETGLGEKIAITYEAINPTEEVLKNKISVIGNDPTTSNSLLYNDSTKKYIDSAKVTNNSNDSLNLEIISTNIDSLKSNTPVSNKRRKLDMAEFGFTTFDVHWDKDKSEFYADIEINQNKLDHYSTLLKFGVCRYQKYSIIQPGFYDYRFSDVVMTDMVSILPFRQVERENRQYTIKGKPGGRYIFKNSNYEAPVFSPNKLYLISEINDVVNKDISCLLNEEKLEEVVSEEKILNVPFTMTIDKNYKNHFLEEYEDIPLYDGFMMNENDHHYNPRNDPRKRLIFFYKIPN